jgi:nitrate reductase NapE component
MRLSETSLRPRQAPSPAQQRMAEQEHNRQRKARIWKTGLSFGMLAMLAAAVVGAIGFGRQLITHAANDPNPNCTLIVPNQPLSAQGLATPYQLTATNPRNGPCNEANPAQTAFVQGAVFDPATSQISVYNPLVIDKGTQAAAPPVMPQLPANAVVALWFGFNGDTLRLQGANQRTLAAANCVNGLGNSLFGQFAYCNAPQFFRAANQAIQAGNLMVPALGTANDGMPCPTVRDFSVVDQDQSDNVTTTYLVTQNGQIAQNTAANTAALAGTHVQVNASDNRLLDVALDGALGCTPWMAPDLADNGKLVPALPLNELQAAMSQQAPVALIPTGDPMVLVNGKPNLVKTNLYRIGVDQPAIGNRQGANGNTALYCQNMLQIAPPRIKLDMPLTINRAPPDAGVGNSLFTFLAARFNLAFGPNGLNCPNLINQQSPIVTQTDGNGVAINATINLNGNTDQGNNAGTGDQAGNNTGNTDQGGNNAGTGDQAGNTGTGGTGNQTNNGDQANAPTCLINGAPIQGCTGTTTINGQTCTIAFDANTRQVSIDCQ